MNKEKLIPKLRFKKFEDIEAWQRYLLEELVEVNNGKDYKHLEKGDIPVYGTGGYMTNVNAALSYEKDAIGIGRKGTIDKPYILKAPYWTVDTLFYAIPKFDSNINFFHGIFKNINWLAKQESTGVPSLSKSTINNIEILIPTIQEQQEIGTFLKKIDEMIQLQQSKVNKVKDIKSAYLSEMFPKEGEKYPKKRFEGFSKPWDEEYLGSLSNITTGALDANAMNPTGKYDFYTSGIQKYRIDTPAFEGPAITIAGNGATVGYMHLADGSFNAYQRTYVLTQFHAVREFLYLEIGRKLPVKIRQEARMGNIPYIVMDMLADLTIHLPSREEQQKIAEFFTNLDNQISIEEEKLSKLEKLKQAYLNDMFV